MTTELRILAVDWERLQRAYPETDADELVDRVIDRGLTVLKTPDDAGVEWAAEAVGALALTAVHRFDYATGRDRFARASELERMTYEHELELNRDIVPPLKEKAKALRAEIRRLEEEVRRVGLDPNTVLPRVNWDNTLAVETYSRPEYESNEARRRRTLEFFRRIRPD